ncbi:MAG TPA: LLM class F420-dependent oxidoreductase [Rhodoglobus sp.]|nr:LLM class F420-dependent oxidoreductase [Rhodoglobus sp.]
MDFRIFTEPQNGATYDDQLALALTAERLGFDAYFRSDHFLSMRPDPGAGPTDSWVTLAGLARETSSIRLGTLVSSATFRWPGLLAIQVAQVDAMSGGRVELGLGTGWFEREHTAYGIPFPERRFGPFEEQLEIVTGLWAAEGTYSFHGEHYDLTDAPALPKPVQSPPPIIVGGSGPKRTPQLAARYAHEFNSWYAPAPTLAARIARLHAACEAIGRDPASLVLSIAGTTVVGPDEATLARRAAAAGQDPGRVRDTGFGGGAAEVVDRLGELRDAGVTRVYLQVLDLADHDQLEFLAAEVVPQLA